MFIVFSSLVYNNMCLSSDSRLSRAQTHPNRSSGLSLVNDVDYAYRGQATAKQISHSVVKGVHDNGVISMRF